jgi:hypothetical protein
VGGKGEISQSVGDVRHCRLQWWAQITVHCTMVVIIYSTVAAL